MRIDTYKQKLDSLGRFRAMHRMMLHRRNYAYLDLVWVEWMIGSLESDLDAFLNGEPF